MPAEGDGLSLGVSPDVFREQPVRMAITGIDDGAGHDLGRQATGREREKEDQEVVVIKALPSTASAGEPREAL